MTRGTRRWLLGWRDITGCGEDQNRSSRAIIPRSAVNDTFLLMMPSSDPRLVANLYANLSSIAFDYCARQKVGGVQPEVLHYEAASWVPTRRTYATPRTLGAIDTGARLAPTRVFWNSPIPRGTSRRSQRIAVTTVRPSSGIPGAAASSGARLTPPSSTCTESPGTTPRTSSTRFPSSRSRRRARTANTGQSESCWRPTTR